MVIVGSLRVIIWTLILIVVTWFVILDLQLSLRCPRARTRDLPSGLACVSDDIYAPFSAAFTLSAVIGRR